MRVPFPLPDAVLYHLRASQPRECLRQICDELERVRGIQAQSITELLMAAETVGGSAIGDGVAVVSCRAPAGVMPGRICAFAKLARPVFFKGVEAHPCDLVFVIISPEDQSQAHLCDLSTAIRALRDHDFTSRLRAESSPERIMSLFRARDVALRTAA